jgi:hypothetical protein
MRKTILQVRSLFCIGPSAVSLFLAENLTESEATDNDTLGSPRDPRNRAHCDLKTGAAADDDPQESWHGRHLLS